jgi:hypothetical protein
MIRPFSIRHFRVTCEPDNSFVLNMAVRMAEQIALWYVCWSRSRRGET